MGFARLAGAGVKNSDSGRSQSTNPLRLSISRNRNARNACAAAPENQPDAE